MGNNTDEPPKDGGEAAANNRIFYEVHVAGIREFKRQEWHAAYMAFLLFGAIVTAVGLLPRDWGHNPFLIALIAVIVLTAIVLILRAIAESCVWR